MPSRGVEREGMTIQDSNDGVEVIVKRLILLDMAYIDRPGKSQAEGGGEILAKSYPMQRPNPIQLEGEAKSARSTQTDLGDRAVE